MNRMSFFAAILSASLLFGGSGGSFAKAPAQIAAAPAKVTAPASSSRQLEKGLAWLADHQLKNGGWGQGDESAQMGNSMEGMVSTPNVADSSMAVLAFLRAGHTPLQGKYKNNVARGIGYILSEIEASDQNSLYVTQVRGTRVQAKIGTYVDTFTALMVLTEAKGLMGSPEENKRLDKARAKVVAKVEKNQQADGRFGDQGWAPALTQGLAAKSLNKAARAGDKIDRKVMERVDKQSQAGFDAPSGSFSAEGTAGVSLYGGAAQSASIAETAATFKDEEARLEREVKEAKTEDDRSRAKNRIAEGRKAVQVAQDAEKALLKQLDDPQFIAGFGNNGGEEFLSYLFVSETLAARNDKEWKEWNGKITRLLHNVQNQDGSWTGHHCITGRTFVTSAAVLVLTADHSPGTKLAGK